MKITIEEKQDGFYKVETEGLKQNVNYETTMPLHIVDTVEKVLKGTLQ